MTRKRILSMLVLLAAVVTGAVAQTTYKVSVKEGTEDATSWTIAPPEATTTGVAQGTEVTASYGGVKKVKSVKAKKAATAPAAAIAPALMDGATVVIEYNCDGFVTYFTFTNNGGNYSCNITGDESDYFSASLTKQGNTLVFVAQHSEMPDSFDSTINFDTTSDTYSFAKKTEELFYFKISVNGTDITDKLSETAAAETTVTWTTAEMNGYFMVYDGWGNNNSHYGITVTASGSALWEANNISVNGPSTFTFTSTVGNIKSIVITADDINIDEDSAPTGWTITWDYPRTLSWNGTASTTVDLPLSDGQNITGISTIVFTVVE